MSDTSNTYSTMVAPSSSRFTPAMTDLICLNNLCLLAACQELENGQERNHFPHWPPFLFLLHQEDRIDHVLLHNSIIPEKPSLSPSRLMGSVLCYSLFCRLTWRILTFTLAGNT